MSKRSYNKVVLEMRRIDAAGGAVSSDCFAEDALKAEYNLSFITEIRPIIPIFGPDIRENLNYVQSYAANAVASEDFFTHRQNLKSYSLLLTHSGEGELVYEGKTYSLREGDCALIDCEKEHFYRTVSPEGWRISQVHFFGKHLKYAMDQWGNLNQAVVNMKGNSVFLPTFVALGDNCQENELKNALTIDCNLTYLVCAMVNTALSQNQAAYPRNIRKVKEYIEREYAKDLSLDIIANENYISKYYMCRNFVKYVGKSPMKYLKEIRILNAKYMLLNTEDSVQDVAAKVGFNGYNYFFNVFKQAEGITPIEYRNRTYKY